jgi:hypothetical protein
MPKRSKKKTSTPKKYSDGQIVAVNDDGQIDESVKVYDLSLTRNVVQMIIALALLVWIMISIAQRYNSGQGCDLGTERTTEFARAGYPFCYQRCGKA